MALFSSTAGEPKPLFTPSMNGQTSPGGEWQYRDTQWIRTSAAPTVTRTTVTPTPAPTPTPQPVSAPTRTWTGGFLPIEEEPPARPIAGVNYTPQPNYTFYDPKAAPQGKNYFVPVAASGTTPTGYEHITAAFPQFAGQTIGDSRGQLPYPTGVAKIWSDIERGSLQLPALIGTGIEAIGGLTGPLGKVWGEAAGQIGRNITETSFENRPDLRYPQPKLGEVGAIPAIIAEALPSTAISIIPAIGSALRIYSLGAAGAASTALNITMSTGGVYQDLKERGFTDIGAKALSTVAGVAAGLVENRLGPQRLIFGDKPADAVRKGFVGWLTNLAKTTSVSAVEEGAEEVVQDFLGNLAVWMRDPTKPLVEGLAESAVGGAGAGAILGGGIAAVDFKPGRPTQKTPRGTTVEMPVALPFDPGPPGGGGTSGPGGVFDVGPDVIILPSGAAAQMQEAPDTTNLLIKFNTDGAQGVLDFAKNRQLMAADDKEAQAAILNGQIPINILEAYIESPLDKSGKIASIQDRELVRTTLESVRRVNERMGVDTNSVELGQFTTAMEAQLIPVQMERFDSERYGSFEKGDDAYEYFARMSSNVGMLGRSGYTTEFLRAPFVTGAGRAFGGHWDAADKNIAHARIAYEVIPAQGELTEEEKAIVADSDKNGPPSEDVYALQKAGRVHVIRNVVEIQGDAMRPRSDNNVPWGKPKYAFERAIQEERDTMEEELKETEKRITQLSKLAFERRQISSFLSDMKARLNKRIADGKIVSTILPGQRTYNGWLQYPGISTASLFKAYFGIGEAEMRRMLIDKYGITMSDAFDQIDLSKLLKGIRWGSKVVETEIQPNEDAAVAKLRKENDANRFIQNAKGEIETAVADTERDAANYTSQMRELEKKQGLIERKLKKSPKESSSTMKKRMMSWLQKNDAYVRQMAGHILRLAYREGSRYVHFNGINRTLISERYDKSVSDLVPKDFFDEDRQADTPIEVVENLSIGNIIYHGGKSYYKVGQTRRIDGGRAVVPVVPVNKVAAVTDERSILDKANDVAKSVGDKRNALREKAVQDFGPIIYGIVSRDTSIDTSRLTQAKINELADNVARPYGFDESEASLDFLLTIVNDEGELMTRKMPELANMSEDTKQYIRFMYHSLRKAIESRNNETFAEQEGGPISVKWMRDMVKQRKARRDSETRQGGNTIEITEEQRRKENDFGRAIYYASTSYADRIAGIQWRDSQEVLLPGPEQRLDLAGSINKLYPGRVWMRVPEKDTIFIFSSSVDQQEEVTSELSLSDEKDESKKLYSSESIEKYLSSVRSAMAKATDMAIEKAKTAGKAEDMMSKYVFRTSSYGSESSRDVVAKMDEETKARVLKAAVLSDSSNSLFEDITVPVQDSIGNAEQKTVSFKKVSELSSRLENAYTMSRRYGKNMEKTLKTLVPDPRMVTKESDAFGGDYYKVETGPWTESSIALFQTWGRIDPTTYKRITQDEAIAFVRRFIKDENLAVVLARKLMTADGAQAYGAYYKSAIYFAENPDETTPSHEVVHAWLDLFAPSEMKEAALSEAQRRHKAEYGTDLSRIQAEEMLADAFPRWVKNQDSMRTTVVGKILTYFQAVWSAMKDMVGQGDAFDALFRDIYSGRGLTDKPKKSTSLFPRTQTEYERSQERAEFGKKMNFLISEESDAARRTALMSLKKAYENSLRITEKDAVIDKYKRSSFYSNEDDRVWRNHQVSQDKILNQFSQQSSQRWRSIYDARQETSEWADNELPRLPKRDVTLPRGAAPQVNASNVPEQMRKSIPIKVRKAEFVQPEQKKVVTAAAALKLKLRAAEKAAGVAARYTKNKIEEYQQEVVTFLRNSLPWEERGKFISSIKNANTPAKMTKALEAIEIRAIQYANLKEARKYVNSLKSKLSFLKLIGGFNQRAVRDARNQLGLSGKTILTAQELDALISELETRLAFKMDMGYRPTNMEKEAQRPITKEEYAAAAAMDDTPPARPKRIMKEIGVSVDKFVSGISSRLNRIHPKLKYMLRGFEGMVKSNVHSAHQQVTPFLAGVKKMSKEDQRVMNLAMLNASMTVDPSSTEETPLQVIERLTAKYGIDKEYQMARAYLDDVHERAKAEGLKLGYIKNYWPNLVEDYEGLMDHLGSTERKSRITKAIAALEMSLSRKLDTIEKAKLINSYIRGYTGNQIGLGGIKPTKTRVIGRVDPEMAQFYSRFDAAAIEYIETIEESIARRRFFGANIKTDAEGRADFNGSIGALMESLRESGVVSYEDEATVRDMFRARFNQQGPGKWVSAYKNLSYVDTLGSVLSALTQIADVGLSIIKAGPTIAAKSLAKTIFNKNQITKEDLGLEEVGAEFTRMGWGAGFVHDVFRFSGLNLIDRLGKNTLIEASLAKNQQFAKKRNPEFMQMLRNVFGDEQVVEQVVENFKVRKIGENEKLVLFNDMLDLQPLALSEMPEKYLTSGNGRIFYQLKTWALKSVDVIRDRAIDKMRTPGKRMEGARELGKIIAVMVLANASVDELKDFIAGRKGRTFSDRVVDSLLKIFLVNRYMLRESTQVGVGSALMQQIRPPTNTIDNVWRDVWKFATKGTDMKTTDLRTPSAIPLLGRLWYYWFGPGAGAMPVQAEKKEKPGTRKIPTTPNKRKIPTK